MPFSEIQKPKMGIGTTLKPTNMKLFFREKGKGEPLIILHGLWGASDNWLPIAQTLSDRFRVILPDLRNHGQSPHADEMDYESMSEDIIRFIEELQLPTPPCIAGHSMGGKVVMALLLKKPELVKKAAVIDIAPISYSTSDGGRHSHIIDFMSGFNLAAYDSREELTEAIKQRFRTERAQQLFLKNIRKTAQGFEWKINHQVINANFDKISGCPGKLPHNQYDREILFVKGGLSDLIPDTECLKKEFPKARMQVITDCGHWVHSEQPEALAQMMREYFGDGL